MRLRGVVTDDGFIRVDGDGTGNWAFARGRVEELRATVSVTRPVDHPSRDPVGTVRADGTRVWVKVDARGDAAENFEPPYDDYTGVWWDIMGNEERTGDQVEEWPIVGAVPNTPAWEALTALIASRYVTTFALGLGDAVTRYAADPRRGAVPAREEADA